jgi:tetratricopeptide (TPR) repeat protein
MAQILKLPVQPTKLGYRRVRRRCKTADNPNQLDLFDQSTAKIVNFAQGLSPFEQALISDEHGDGRAADLYHEAIEKDDCVADALCNLGIIETQRRNTIKAFDCFTGALKLDPRHSEAHYNLANLYFELNDFQLAQLHFEMAVEVDPEFANAYYNLALVHAINNKPAEAASALTKYKQLVTDEEANAAGEMFEQIKNSIAILRNSRAGSN